MNALISCLYVYTVAQSHLRFSVNVIRFGGLVTISHSKLKLYILELTKIKLPLWLRSFSKCRNVIPNQLSSSCPSYLHTCTVWKISNLVLKKELSV